LDEANQHALCNFALNLGEHSETGGFWQTLPDGEKVLNSGKDRGRIYDAISKYPENYEIQNLCMELAKLAMKHDSRMPMTTPTHLLLLYYASEDGMYWHRDSDKK